MDTPNYPLPIGSASSAAAAAAATAAATTAVAAAGAAADAGGVGVDGTVWGLSSLVLLPLVLQAVAFGVEREVARQRLGLCCVCMRVCVYVCMYLYMSICVYMCTYMHKSVYTYLYIERQAEW